MEMIVWIRILDQYWKYPKNWGKRKKKKKKLLLLSLNISCKFKRGIYWFLCLQKGCYHIGKRKLKVGYVNSLIWRIYLMLYIWWSHQFFLDPIIIVVVMMQICQTSSWERRLYNKKADKKEICVVGFVI